jgi:hypothetical protein
LPGLAARALKFCFYPQKHFLLTPPLKPFNLAVKTTNTDKGTYENFCNQPETYFMAVAFLANMAMAVATVIKDALNSCDISLQQLLRKLMAVADPKADNTHVSLFLF